MYFLYKMYRLSKKTIHIHKIQTLKISKFKTFKIQTTKFKFVNQTCNSIVR